jgi:PAB-dependent poly(A)-specific ribonuclease subunit 2
MTFCEVLKSSVERVVNTKGWCIRCKGHRTLETRNTIQYAPGVLMLNAAVNSAEARQLWSVPGWLPEEIGVIVAQGQFFCYQGKDLEFQKQKGRTSDKFDLSVYSLIGLAADINSGQHQKPHLVSLVNGQSAIIIYSSHHAYN